MQKVLKKKKGYADKKYNVIPFAFKHLFSCGECGRSITAETKTKPSGKRYTYYRCTKYCNNCSQKPVREKELEKEVKKLLKVLNISENGFKYVVAGLKESLQDKRASEDKILSQLERERSLLKTRMDKMYEDKLDGKIQDDFYNSKAEKWAKRIKEIDKIIALRDRADINYYDFGVKILELAKNAYSLYKKGSTEEKQELLHFLLSDSLLKDKKPLFKLKIPFKQVYERGQRSEWYP